MKKRVFTLVDGNNFYHRMHELGLRALLDFNYKEFGRFLAEDRPAKAKYYIGIVRLGEDNEKVRALIQNQQRLLSKLTKEEWEIGRGFLLEWDGKFHEKGVDVQMATDILVGAYEDLYDAVVLVSSDTDLIPVIKKARDKGKMVEYIGFAHKVSYALKANADRKRLLTKSDLEKFLIK